MSAPTLPAESPPTAEGTGSDGVTRRCFIKWSALAGASFVSVFGLDEIPGQAISAAAPAFQGAANGTRIVRVGCPSHNCGGRCLLNIRVPPMW